jgi:outer membrane receptor for Fe3+-dicitrate
MACRRFHGTAKERTMKHLCRTAMVGLAVVLLAGTAIAQTTGRIVGKIVDSSGAALPGVTVTVTSPSLQGANTTVTDGEGNYRFPTLPPGTYQVKTALSGFKTMEQANVAVGLDRTVEVNLTMPVAAVEETVRVEAASPVVDTTSTTTGVNAKAELFNRLPVQRDFYSIARVAPGTTEDRVGTSVFGSSGAENQYIIEGLNSTGIERSEKIKQLNFDFVQEIEVKTGGLNAEYGRMTGGVINVITKSGGNNFSGSLFGFNEGGALQSNDSTAGDRPTYQTTVANIDRKWDFGGNLGGYIVRDKLWFFGAYNHVFQRINTVVIRDLNAPGAPGIGSEVPDETNRDLASGKLTYKLSSSQTLTGSVNADPAKSEGNRFAISGPPSTYEGTLKTGSTDAVVRYDGVFGSSFLLRGTYGRHGEKNKIDGPGKTIPLSVDQTVNPSIRTGGFGGYFQDSDFSRDIYKVDATKFWAGHEIKGGIDWEIEDSSIDRYNAGAGIINTKLTSGGVVYYRHRYYVNDLAPGFDRNVPATYQALVPLTTEPGTKNTAFYAQDSWKVLSNLSINGGIRWERQEVGDRDGQTVFDLKKNWAPRIGAVWDFSKNGRSKIYGNWGRFYESIPLDINIRSFGGELICFCYNFDPNPLNTLPAAGTPSRTSLLGGATPADPNLRGQYIDEFIIGGEYEVAQHLSVGVKYVHRNLGRVIEDFLVPSEGTYFIANPSQGLGQEMAFYDYTPIAAPKPKRVNDSIEFSARKQFTNGWQFLASYVYSKLEGNYDGTFQNSTGQLDPNINSAFDYADFLVNAEGPLTNDRRNQFKFDGSYEFSKGALTGLNLGLSTHAYSGLPLNAYGYSFAYANWEYFLAPRGSLGRGPSDWEANLQASYPIRVGPTARINILMDVFNLFDRQHAIQLDERYNLALNGRCSAVPAAQCNGDNGWLTVPDTLTPLGSLANPNSSTLNPDFQQKGVLFTQPRSIRLGVRFLW